MKLRHGEHGIQIILVDADWIVLLWPFSRVGAGGFHQCNNELAEHEYLHQNARIHHCANFSDWRTCVNRRLIDCHAFRDFTRDDRMFRFDKVMGEKT